MFHHHETGDDLLATHLGHTKYESCELDAYFCQTGIHADCEHHVHLSKALSKCNTCKYHYKKFDSHSVLAKRNVAVSQACVFVFEPIFEPAIFIPENAGRDPPMLL